MEEISSHSRGFSRMREGFIRRNGRRISAVPIEAETIPLHTDAVVYFLFHLTHVAPATAEASVLNV